jgi:hypothetical protein
MANLEKKLNKFGLNGKVYRSREYQKTYGLKTTDEAKKVFGDKGIKSIGSDITTDKNKAGEEGIKVSNAAISTGGGDPLPKGSHDNEFLVAENAEEAEEMRERTDGEIPVRTLQYRNGKGQFSDSPDKVQRKLKEKAGDNSREYFRSKSGLSDEEFEERIKSLGITKDDFVYECLNNINSVSKGLVDKKSLLHHLRRNEGLTHKQALRIHDELKYGRKDDTFNKNTPDERYKNFLVKFYQIMNENAQKAKRRGPIKRKMRRIIKENKEKSLKKQQNQNQNQNQNADNLDKVRNEATNVRKGINLSQYSQQEINQAKEEAKKYGGNPNDEMELEYRINQNRKDRGQ